MKLGSEEGNKHTRVLKCFLVEHKRSKSGRNPPFSHTMNIIDSFHWREAKYMINTFKMMGRRKILDEYFQNDGEKKNTWCCQVLHALCLWSWYWPLLLWGCRAHISLYKWLAIIIIIIIIL